MTRTTTNYSNFLHFCWP